MKRPKHTSSTPREAAGSGLPRSGTVGITAGGPDGSGAVGPTAEGLPSGAVGPTGAAPPGLSPLAAPQPPATLLAIEDAGEHALSGPVGSTEVLVTVTFRRLALTDAATGVLALPDTVASVGVDPTAAEATDGPDALVPYTSGPVGTAGAGLASRRRPRCLWRC